MCLRGNCSSVVYSQFTVVDSKPPGCSPVHTLQILWQSEYMHGQDGEAHLVPCMSLGLLMLVEIQQVCREEGRGACKRSPTGTRRVPLLKTGRQPIAGVKHMAFDKKSM